MKASINILKYFALIWLMLLSAKSIDAQNIVKFEYFFDTDPGFGLGTSVVVSPTTSVNNLNIATNTSSLAAGFHTLYIRSKNDLNQWSDTQNRGFFLLSTPPSPNNITQVEYFIDTDPGVGAATVAPGLTPGTTLTNFPIDISPASLTAGTHTFYVRSKTSNGQWTLTYISSFDVVNAVSPPSITSFSPTSGNAGTPVTIMGTNFDPIAANNIVRFNGVMATVVSSTSTSISTIVPSGVFTSGTITVTVAGLIANSSTNFTINAPQVVAGEYFFDNDPGFGSGTPISVTPGATVDISNLDVPTSSLTIGWHIMGVRFKDTNNSWSPYTIRNIYVRSTTVPDVLPPSPIVAMEYFYDNVTDPGTGTSIAITNGTSVDVPATTLPQSLTTGWHTIHLRTKNQDGKWGFYETRQLFVIPPGGTIDPPAKPITAMEYFFDAVTDPGTGTPVTITNGTLVDVPNLTINNSLSLGWHSIHVRTKNGDEKWGFYETRQIFIRSTSASTSLPPSPIVAMEYFYDNVTDPGTGTPISVATSTSVDIASTDLANTLPLGWHSVHVRTKNQDNGWGFYETRQIYIRSTTVATNAPPSPIVAFEYFVDNDPGVGLSSFQFTKPPATSFDLTNEPLDLGTLSVAAHQIGIRAKDQNNNWSTTQLASFTVTTACAITTPPTSSNMNRCDPGTLTLTASGATGSQVYRWYADNTTFTVLYTGASFTTPSISTNTNYFVSIYDPTTYCESTRTQVTASVGAIPKPVLNLTGTLAVCEGNSVTLTAPNGFTVYTWSNGQTTQQITVSATGNYSVVVGNGTCTSVSSDVFAFTVNPKPTKPVISASGGGSLCGGAVTLTAPAGFSSYSWSSGQTTPSIIVNAVGNFTVSVTDANGCQSPTSDVSTVTAASISKPVVTVTGNTTICGSGTVQLTAPAGFTQYTWSNGATTNPITVSTAGNYSLTVSNGSCISPSSDPVTISVVATAAKPTITVMGFTALCNSSFTVLNAPSGYSNYLWSTGETTRQIIVSTAGSFTVQVGNAATCLSVSSDPAVITLTGAECPGPVTPPTATNASRCGTGSVNLNASGATGSQEYRWYDAPTGGTLLFTGATFVTPSVSTNTNFYVSKFDPTLTSESSRVMSTVTIVTIAAPVLSGPSSISICAGSSTLLTAPSGSVQYLWSNGATTQQIQISTAATYSVKVGDGTCMSPSSNAVTVSVVPSITKPVITITGNTTICGSGTVQLSAPAGYTYNWSNGATTQSITVSAANDYSVTVSNGTCTSPTSDPVTVSVATVLPKPIITVTSSTGTNTLCVGGFAVLTAPTSSYYLWSTGETSQKIVVNAAGTFTVKVGNAPTCLSTSSDPVTILSTGTSCQSGPTAPGSPLVSNQSSCGAASFSFTASGATGSQVYKWYDAPSAGNLLLTGNPFITQTISATTTYYATIFDSSSGESAPTTVTAKVVNLAAPTISGPSTIAICSGSNTLLSAPSGFIQYLWSNGATTQQLQVSTANTYSVQVGDGTCLSAPSNSIVVTVSPTLTKPTITANGSTIFCGSGSVALDGPSGFSSYTWSTSANTNSITATSAGNYTLVVSDGVCTSPVSDPITITSLSQPSKPTIIVTGPTALCNNAVAVLEVPAGFTSYIWSNGQTDNRIAVKPADAGFYSVRVGNAASCLSVSSDDVHITATGLSCGSNAAPIAPVATGTPHCGPGSVVLSATGAFGNQVYEWYDVATNGIPLAENQSGLFNTPSISVNTNYYVAIRDLDTNLESTRTSVTASITVIQTPVINPAGTFNICQGEIKTLTAPSGFQQYKWTSGNNTYDTQLINVTTSGTYTLQVGTSSCLSAASLPVVVNVSPLAPKPLITVLSGSPTFCNGSVQISGPSGFSSYLWSNGATTQTITLDKSIVVTLVVKNQGGCSSEPSLPFVATRLEEPCKPNTAPVIADIPISVDIEGSVTVDLFKYISDAEDNLDLNSLHFLTAATAKGITTAIDASYHVTFDYKGVPFTGTDRITLEVADLFNLRAQKVININVVGDVIVFNGVTPDGDGKNDFFYIQYLDVVENGLKNKVTLFNRWGDIVFDITDYNNVDRVFAGVGNNGNLLPPGTYFYKIDFTAGGKPVTGYMTLKH